MDEFNPQNPKMNLTNMRSNLTLDLNQAKKLPQFNLALAGVESSLLTPSDIHKLKMNTPDIENMILDNPMPNTPTPSFHFAPTDNVTEEQKKFATGFVEALSNLRNGNSQHNSDSNTSTLYNEPLPFIPHIKEEPNQTVPMGGGSPPMSPVDMEQQERIKLERKRQRNRLAASKCRNRKLERISKLEEKVKLLKIENSDLGSTINQLKETVGLLKLEVMDHTKAGCQIVLY